MYIVMYLQYARIAPVMLRSAHNGQLTAPTVHSFRDVAEKRASYADQELE